MPHFLFMFYGDLTGQHILTTDCVLGLGNWIISMISAHEINEKRQQQIQNVSLLNDRLFLTPYASRKGQGAMFSLRF